MTAALLAICCCTAGAIFLLSPTTASRNHRGAVAVYPSPCNRHSEEGPGGVGLTKSQAEDLLDWLEANGRNGKLSFVSGEGFRVC